jgi:hypothetical protein
MKKWPNWFVLVFTLVFVLSQTIPAKATGSSTITYHVLTVNPSQTIADSEGTITWAGSLTNSTCYGISCAEPHVQSGGLSLHNNCEGTDCSAQNIYWKVDITGVWNSGYSQVPNLYFTSGVVGQVVSFPCDGTGTDGTCSYHDSGMIPAEAISTDSNPNEVHETFAFYFDPDALTRLTSLHYSIIVSTSPIEDKSCSDEYLPGNKFASFTLAATNEVGVNLSSNSGWPAPGTWVEIKVASGSWKNNGTGPDLTGLAIGRFASAPYRSGWDPLSSYAHTGCHKGETEYYVQVSDSALYKLRVNDTDEDFSSNTGTLSIELYNVTNVPYKTQCDANYKIGGQIETRSINAINSNGITMATGKDSTWFEQTFGGEGAVKESPGYLMLELDRGPHWDGVSNSYSGEINVGGSWYSVEEFPTASCIVQLDTMGRYRIYFPYDPSLLTWKFRATDENGTYSDNTGVAGYTLSYVDRLQIYTPGDAAMECSPKYAHVSTGSTITLQANTAVSHTLTLTGGNLYALESSGGPWSNNGSLSFGIAISTNGTDWKAIYDFDYALCASTGADANHAIVYLQALPGVSYRVRVDDPGNNFSDNSGSINLIVYAASTTIQDWTACDSNYIFSELNIPQENRTIPAQFKDGTSIPYIESGKYYALEITDQRYWTNSALDLGYRYDADISKDGGSTWQPYQSADFISCAIQIAKGTAFDSRYKIIFKADGNYKLRSHADVGLPTIYPPRIGSLIYKLYEVNPTEAPAAPGTQQGSKGYIPASWRTTCYEACNRPLSLFVTISVNFGTLGSVPLPIPDIMGWIDYSRCAIQQFLSWCPEHTAALLSIMKLFNDREPFGTLLELEKGFTGIKTELGSLITQGGEGEQFAPHSVIWGAGGGESGDAWSGILPSAKGTPWEAGGQLDLSGVTDNSNVAIGGETGTAYKAYCITATTAVIGDMSDGFCSGINLIKTGFPTLFIGMQVVVDLMSLVFLIDYIKISWIDAGAAS